MKKSLLILIILLFLTSCTGNKKPDTIVDEIPKEPDTIRYTGEIIVDGFYRGYVYFVPDKGTKELLKNKYENYTGDSIQLVYEDTNIISNLPKDLGVYKAEVKADFSQEKWTAELISIELTDNIGTIEYEGKIYETNDLDENVRAKDKVCGLIVSNVRRYDDGGISIDFEGEIESEGFYNVHPGGEFFNYLNVGRIVPNEESLKNIPSYLGEYNDFSVYFIESNNLYQQLAKHSAIGRGKFKSSDYYIVYNVGGGVPPKERLTEIISLDEKYKSLFEFNDDIPIRTLVNETNKYKYGFMDKYAIVHEEKVFDNNQFENNYYFLGKDELSKIKILSSDEFYYGLKENKSSDSNIFELVTDASGKKPHSISFRYFDKNSNGSNKDSIRKTYSYGYFKNGDEIVRIFEGDSILGMNAKDINIEYDCMQDSQEELVRIISEFSGETALTGKLTLYYDEGYGYNRLFFIADDDSIKKLPIHAEDTRDQGGILFRNENLEEILGTEPFEKNCSITINNYMIHFAETEASNSAELISVNFLE